MIDFPLIFLTLVISLIIILLVCYKKRKIKKIIINIVIGTILVVSITNVFANFYVVINEELETFETLNTRNKDFENYVYTFYDYETYLEFQEQHPELLLNPLNGNWVDHCDLKTGFDSNCDYQPNENTYKVDEVLIELLAKEIMNIAKFENYDIVISPTFTYNDALKELDFELLAGTYSKNEDEWVINNIVAYLHFGTTDYESIIGEEVPINYYDCNGNIIYSGEIEIVGIYDANTYGTISKDSEEELLYYGTTIYFTFPNYETFIYKDEFLESSMEEFWFSFSLDYYIPGVEEQTAYDSLANGQKDFSYIYENGEDQYYEMRLWKLIFPIFQIVFSTVLLIIIIRLNYRHRLLKMRYVIISLIILYILPFVTTTIYLTNQFMLIYPIAIVVTIIILLYFIIIAASTKLLLSGLD